MNVRASRPIFPFTAIIGQENIKIALLLNVIEPKIGGVIVIGDRGTGKSTTIRALVDLLPIIEVVLEDPFQSHPINRKLMSEDVHKRKRTGEIFLVEMKKIPIVDLPLGATEDRVCGTIDIEQALRTGIKIFEPGLLARANRGILYVDEVNLLEDHLIDVLLDSSSSGWNTVEREGVSISHPARFILIGSGNPEEGELRPQLLDRFGMHAKILTTRDPKLRIKIVEHRAKFDFSPEKFRKDYNNSQIKLCNYITSATNKLKYINLNYRFRFRIAQLCAELNVDGLRGDIVITRASKALRSFEVVRFHRNPIVNLEYVIRVAPLCLSHRIRKDPLEIIDSDDKMITILTNIFKDL